MKLRHLLTGGLAATMLIVIEDAGAGLLNETLLHLPGADKLLHFAQSAAAFGVVFWWAGRRSPAGGRITLAAVVALTLATVDEMQQYWRADRHVDIGDLTAAVAGVLAAISVTSYRRPRRLRAAGVTLAVAICAGLTYRSYLDTKDYSYGVLAERAGRRDEAIQHYLRAAASGSTNPEVYNAAAWAIVDSGIGDPAEAVRLAERSLEMRPSHPDTLDTYGWALYRAGRVTDAVAPLEQALSEKPDIYCVHYHLGMAYLALGDTSRAVHQLGLQIELKPATREAAWAAAELKAIDGGGTRSR